MTKYHPDFMDFGADDMRIKQSVVMGIWAIAKELKRIADAMEEDDEE